MMMSKRKPARTEPSELALVFNNSLQLSQLTVEKVAANLRSNLTEGLSSEEVKWRTLHYGPNEITMRSPEPKWKKFLMNFREPLILLLLLSAFVSFVLQSYKDAVSITISVILVVIVAFVQEARSEKSLQVLKKLMPPTCTAFRNGEAVTLLAMELVPGDIVLLTLGDRVPADLRIFESVQLTIDESNFTGEAIPVPKSTIIHERNERNTAENKLYSNLAFMGTLVVAGSGRGLVANCGDRSEFGEIVRMVQDEEAPMTPLRRSMSILGIQLTFLAGFVIILIAIIGIIQGRSLHTVFNISVSLAVAAIPEGLPIVVTVTLALGVLRMAKRNVIVKKLPAVETLGCVNVICSDKTGTLTKNEMTVAIIVSTHGAIADVSGTGYSSEGVIKLRGVATKTKMDNIYSILEIGLLCNNAQIVQGDKIIGRPTEAALVVVANKNNMQNVLNQYERLDELPFSSETKIMVVKCVRKDDAARKPIYFIKGATDVVLQRCTKYMIHGDVMQLSSEKTNELIGFSARLGMQGLRVLAMARGDSMQDLIFYGCVGITDPPRPLIRRAIRLITDSGARVIMLTGDARETALSIGDLVKIWWGAIKPTEIKPN